jgi:4'-phosphopantetheinyl transferase
MLQPHVAHVWAVRCDAASTGVGAASDALRGCLSEAELLRAERLHSTRARDRFTLTRGALRNILSRYADEPAARLEIETSERGKPLLAGAPQLHFSVSHSMDVALVAVAQRPVGVDIEHYRRPRDLERVARRLFHERTVAALLATPEEARLMAFLDAWTQREAHVKALGGGLFHTPDTLPFQAGQPRDGSVRVVADEEHHGEWSVAHFVPGTGYCAALVARGRIERLQFLDWKGAPT